MKTRIIFIFVALVVFCTCTFAASGQNRKKAATASNPKSAGLSTITVNGVADIDPAKAFGSKDGVLVIEVFSDFQCPACKQLFETTLARLRETYVDSAIPCKIYVVHRDFTWPYHAYSRIAASYSRAAAHIGKCREVEAALFQNQAKWEASGDVKGTVAAVLTPSEMKRVQALVDAKTLEPLIERDELLGQNLPVHATPTIVIHTRDAQSYPVAGIVSYDVLKSFLDQLIQQTRPS